MSNKYWHKLSKEEKKKLSNIKTWDEWEELIKEYRQPDWCNYLEALNRLGCLKLLDVENEINIEFCEKAYWDGTVCVWCKSYKD